ESCGSDPGLTMNPEKAGTTNAFWMPTVVFDINLGLTPEILVQAFRAENIDTRAFFHPLSTHPLFQPAALTTISRDIAQRAVNLPAYADMQDDEQKRVIDTVKAIARMKANATSGQNR